MKLFEDVIPNLRTTVHKNIDVAEDGFNHLKPQQVEYWSWPEQIFNPNEVRRA